MVNKVVLGLLICWACWACWAEARAETRVWTDRKGNAIEAKFINLSGKKVVLETPQGKKMMVPLAGLCDKDHEYLAITIPPKLSIDVDCDTERQKLSQASSYTKKKETFTFNISIQKMNKEKCTRKLKAYLYVVAEAVQGNRRKILDIEVHSFTFTDEDAIRFSAESSVINVESYSSEFGWEYEGYLLCVEDDVGNIIAVDTNKSTYEESLQAFRKSKKGKAIDI